MKFNINYREHKFVKESVFGFSNYICDTCEMTYYEFGNYYSIKWSEYLFEMFNKDNILTCPEVQIKRLLE